MEGKDKKKRQQSREKQRRRKKGEKKEKKGEKVCLIFEQSTLMSFVSCQNI
jgi:hypothetical protein